MNHKQKKKIVGIILIIGLVLITLVALGVIKLNNSSSNVTTGASGDKIYYPVFASIKCEEKGAQDWVNAEPISSSNKLVTFICPIGTSSCKVRPPTVTCPDWSIYAPLGYSLIWSINVNDGGYIHNFNNIPSIFGGENVPADGYQFSPGANLDFRAACHNNALDLIPFLNQIFDLSIAPTTSNLGIQWIDTHLEVHPAFGGEYEIPNSALCSFDAAGINNQALNKLKSNEPTEASKANAESAAANGGSITSNNAVGDTNTNYYKIKNSPNQLAIGQDVRSVDAWMTLDSYGNKNPLGQYQGNDVLCILGSGLFKLDTVGTEGGINYLAPTSRFSISGEFCCDNNYCKQNGNRPSYNCAFGEYVCKDTPGYCLSDANCQPDGGVLQDKNCYKTNDGKFFLWASTCVNNQCTPAQQEEVKCCDSFCDAYGQVCNYNVGCQNIIPPNQPCPAGQCCDADNLYQYIPKNCDGTLNCCGKTNGVGVCKAKCELPPESKCADCDAFALSTIVGPFWSAKKCQAQDLIDTNPPYLHYPQSVLTCIFSFIKYLLVVVALIFGTLFSLDFLERFKSLQGDKKRLPRFIISVILGLIFAAAIYFAFWIGVILFIGFLIIKFAWKAVI